MNFFELLKQSVKDHLGKPSATRLSGYITMGLITFMVLIISITELIRAFKDFATYTPSAQFLAVMVALLSHQLILFGLKKSNEKSSFPTLEKLNEKDKVSEYDDDTGIITSARLPKKEDLG